MTRINLDYTIFGILIAYISYILYSDTVSIHELPSIPTYIVTIILTVLLMVISIPVVLYTSDTRRDKIVRFTIILSIFASILSAFGFRVNVYLYALMLIAINVLICLIVLDVKEISTKVYGLTLAVITINLTSLAFLNDTSALLDLTLLLFEFLGLIFLIYYTYKLNPNPLVLGISFSIAVGAGILAKFILTKDVPTLILTIVIDQLLGISLYSFNFINIYEVSKTNFFIFHFAEFGFLGSLLVLERKRIRVWNVVIAGLDVSYPPLLLIRVLSVFLLMNSEDEKLHYLDVTDLKTAKLKDSS